MLVDKLRYVRWLLFELFNQRRASIPSTAPHFHMVWKGSVRAHAGDSLDKNHNWSLTRPLRFEWHSISILIATTKTVLLTASSAHENGDIDIRYTRFECPCRWFARIVSDYSVQFSWNSNIRMTHFKADADWVGTTVDNDLTQMMNGKWLKRAAKIFIKSGVFVTSLDPLSFIASILNVARLTRWHVRASSTHSFTIEPTIMAHMRNARRHSIVKYPSDAVRFSACSFKMRYSRMSLSWSSIECIWIQYPYLVDLCRSYCAH